MRIFDYPDFTCSDTDFHDIWHQTKARWDEFTELLFKELNGTEVDSNHPDKTLFIVA